MNRAPVRLLLLCCLVGAPSVPVYAQAVSDREVGAIFRQASALAGQGKYRDAAALYEKCLELSKRVAGDQSRNTVSILGNLAHCYDELGEFAKAEPLLVRALEIDEAKEGKDHIRVADCLNHLASIHGYMAQYDKAEAEYLRAVRIREAAQGKEHVEVAKLLTNLGSLYTTTGQFGKAESALQQSLQTLESHFGKDSPSLVPALLSLGNLASASGQYARAEQIFTRDLRLREAHWGKDHPEVAKSLNNLAVANRRLGQYVRAEELYTRAVQIKEAQLGKDSPHLASSLNNLAVLYSHLGQEARAEQLYARVLQINEAKLGKDHPAVAGSLANLGTAYAERGEFAKAEPLLTRSLAIAEAKQGKNHPEVAVALINLGRVYKKAGAAAKAEASYLKALEILESNFGKDHPEAGDCLTNLGILYYDQGQHAKAEPFHTRALRITEAKLGKDHPHVAMSLNNLAIIQTGRGNWNAAADQTDRLRRIDAAHLRQVLPILGSTEQAQLLDTLDYHYANALSLGLLRKNDAALVARSAGWLLNSKGIAQQALADRALLERDLSDPARRKLVQQLQTVRQERAALALNPPTAGQEKRREALAQQQQTLERQLVQASGQATAADWVELDTVRAAVPPSAVFIDIARFKVSDFQEKKSTKEEWLPARYAAWVIPPKDQGDVQLVDLGEADKIDAAVAEVRKLMAEAQGIPAKPSPIRELGEAEAEKLIQPALAKLAGLVLTPLLDKVGAKTDLILSPDGNLWLVPWAALPLKDGRYAIEKYTLRFVTSGRDLAAPAFSGKVKHDPPLIIADPDFDIEPKEAAQLTAQLLGKQEILNSAVASLTIPPGTRSAIGRVGRLPGTAVEAAAIKPKLEALAGEAPWVYRGKNGLEGVFKSFHSPKVVVLSTHGYFLETQEAKDAGHAALDKTGKPVENPLLRCGLLLAGCNERSKATGGMEDGVLTGLEIVGCDLRGTELVVLSACETGLGQVRAGEGVAGLRQAFQLAGAQAVVASLWQVSDRDTAFLMSDFFDNLAKGKSKPEALREAQLARIKDHRDRDGAAHPFFWAAFTLTGK